MRMNELRMRSNEKREVALYIYIEREKNDLLSGNKKREGIAWYNLNIMSIGKE